LVLPHKLHVPPPASCKDVEQADEPQAVDAPTVIYPYVTLSMLYEFLAKPL